MVRQYRRSLFDEIDDLRDYMDSMFSQVFPSVNVPLLPTGESTNLPVPFKSEMKADVVEHGDEVIVTVDMVPGIDKKDITLDLINPRALRLSCERRLERKEEKEGYYLRERSFGSVQRIIPLPASVTETGAKSTFKNGVLEVHLKKSKEEKSRIPIE